MSNPKMELDQPGETNEGNSGAASVLPQQLIPGNGLAASSVFYPFVLIPYIGGSQQEQPLILPKQEQPPILLQQKPLDQTSQTTGALPTTNPIPLPITDTLAIGQPLVLSTLPTPPQRSTEGGGGNTEVKLEPILDLQTQTITETLFVERGIGNDGAELRPILDPHTSTVPETSAIGQPPLVSSALSTPPHGSVEGGACNGEVELEPSLDLQVEVASNDMDTSTNPLAIGEPQEKEHFPIPDALECNLPKGLALHFSQDGSISGVRSEKVILKGMLFGPCKGKVVPAPIGSVKDSAWEVRLLGVCLYLDIQPEGSTSSWMARIKCANFEEEQNVEAFQSYGDIFFRTTKSIRPGDELRVFYSKEYAAKVGFRSTLEEIRTAYDKDTEDFHCLACDKTFSSAKSLLRHEKIDHKPDMADKTLPDSTGKECDATVNQGIENSASLSSQRTQVNQNTLKAAINDSPVLKKSLTRKASDDMETEENENLQCSSGQTPKVNAKPTNPVEAIINTSPDIDKGLTLEVSDTSKTQETENSTNSSSLVPQINPVPVIVAINTLPNISAGSAIENEENLASPSRPVPIVNPNPVKPEIIKDSFLKLLIVCNAVENKEDQNVASSLRPVPQVNPNPVKPEIIKDSFLKLQIVCNAVENKEDENSTSTSTLPQARPNPKNVKSRPRTRRYNSVRGKLDANNCTCLRKSLPRGVKREVRKISRKYCTCQLKCTVCGKSFTTPYNLSTHMLTHEAKECICDVCGKAFRYSDQLEKHKKLKHAVTYSCRTCEKKFMVKSEFDKHEKMHAYSCGICEMEFTTEIDLKRHHGNTHGKYGCETCGKRFFLKLEFDKHMKMHKKEQRLEDDAEEEVVEPLAEDMLGMQMNYFDYHRPYKCSYCPKSYVSKKGQLDHEAEKHTKQCPFKCEQCSIGFASKYKFMAHMKKHAKVCLFQCSICTASFPSKRDLKCHEDEHAGLRPVKCEHCGKGFRTCAIMRYHVLRVHDNVRRFACPFCSQLLVDKYAYKVHVRRHKGIRPFLCHECGCTFTSSGSLRSHSNRHKKEKAFGCPQCDRKFSTFQNLTNHIFKVHTSKSEALGNLERTNIATSVDS